MINVKFLIPVFFLSNSILVFAYTPMSGYNDMIALYSDLKGRLIMIMAFFIVFISIMILIRFYMHLYFRNRKQKYYHAALGVANRFYRARNLKPYRFTRSVR